MKRAPKTLPGGGNGEPRGALSPVVDNSPRGRAGRADVAGSNPAPATSDQGAETEARGSGKPDCASAVKNPTSPPPKSPHILLAPPPCANTKKDTIDGYCGTCAYCRARIDGPDWWLK